MSYDNELETSAQYALLGADGADDIDNGSEDEAGDEHANQEEIQDIEDHFDQEQQAQAQQVVEAAQEIQVQINNYVQEPVVQMAQLPEGGANNAREEVPAGQGMAELAEQVAGLRQQVAEMQRGPVVAGIRCRYLAVAAKVIGGVAGALSVYFAIKHLMEGSNSFIVRTERPLHAALADSPVPTPDPDATEKLYKNWLGDSEAGFWENMAVFVDANKPRSFREQLLFMQFTEDLAQNLMAQAFQWKAASDKLGLVNALADTLQKQGLSAAYRQVKGLTYQGLPLPRAISANLMSHALTAWWMNNG